MKIAVLLLLAAALASAAGPFTIEATEDVSHLFPGAPRIQAFSFAQWEGRWLFIGGRKAGYHSVGGGSAEFFRADANRDVWVVDTNVSPARTVHVSLDELPGTLAQVRDQLGATAQLSVQAGSYLYIAGGYGQASNSKWVTFPVISRIDVPAMIAGVLEGRLSAEAIAYAETPAVQSSGGGLVKLSDGFFYLVMGHSFNGNYTTFEGQSEHNSEGASQVYLNEIRKLRIVSAADGRLEVRVVETYRDEAEFHRRDLNVTQTMSPQGPGLAVYGGVFTPDTQLAYSHPVYLFPQQPPEVARGFDQKMNAYSCPTLLIYDAVSQTMYTTFFGGIGRYHWDAGAFVENPRTGAKTDTRYMDGLQWSDQISTVQRSAQDGIAEWVQERALPGFLGANAVFIPAASGVFPDTDILDMSKLRGARTFAGYIYGGIKASPYRFPYGKSAVPHNSGAVPTSVSGLILKVYVDARAQ